VDFSLINRSFGEQQFFYVLVVFHAPRLSKPLRARQHSTLEVPDGSHPGRSQIERRLRRGYSQWQEQDAGVFGVGRSGSLGCRHVFSSGSL
jgi:hypothetical protein